MTATKSCLDLIFMLFNQCNIIWCLYEHVVILRLYNVYLWRKWHRRQWSMSCFLNLFWCISKWYMNTCHTFFSLSNSHRTNLSFVAKFESTSSYKNYIFLEYLLNQKSLFVLWVDKLLLGLPLSEKSFYYLVDCTIFVSYYRSTFLRSIMVLSCSLQTRWKMSKNMGDLNDFIFIYGFYTYFISTHSCDDFFVSFFIQLHGTAMAL